MAFGWPWKNKQEKPLPPMEEKVEEESERETPGKENLEEDKEAE